MKIETYDSQKLDNMKDDIFRLVQGVHGYKERTAEICTVLRNVLDTLTPGWFQDEVQELEELEWAKRQYELYHDVDIAREKNEACEKRFAAMLLDEKTVRILSEEDIWRLLDNSYRQGLGAAYLDQKANDKRERELSMLDVERERRGMPRWPSLPWDD